MNTWTSGYVADVGYTFGYYAELNPLRVRLAFLNRGLVFPETGTACELGFGQGLSTNIHAAASVTRWYGTDFNPSQAACAQEFATASGASAELYDEAFSDFAQRSDLPEFDYIGLHGIWSWVSDENRQIIVDFIRRKLKVGGVLYISYNTLPGWAAFAPMRHLMTEHAEVIGSEGRGIVSRIDDAIVFAQKLLETNPAFARANPQINDRIQKLSEQNRHYLAHEYFNRDWHPMHFATMAEWLEPAKVTYACSAHYLDNVDTVNLTAEQQKFLLEIPDVMFREAVRDFMVNQQFRRDYWVKGARTLSPLEQAEALRSQRVILISYRPDISLKINGYLGEANMSEQIYGPVLDFLADHKVKTISQIEQGVADKAISLVQIMEVVMVLCSAGHLAPAQDEDIISKSRKHTDKLNEHIMRKSRSSNDVMYIASPVTGGGRILSRFEQLFVLSLLQGKKQPQDWVKDVWSTIASQGQRLLKDGKTLETDEENIAELTAIANAFVEKQLPVLKALQIV